MFFLLDNRYIGTKEIYRLSKIRIYNNSRVFYLIDIKNFRIFVGQIEKIFFHIFLSYFLINNYLYFFLKKFFFFYVIYFFFFYKEILLSNINKFNKKSYNFF